MWQETLLLLQAAYEDLCNELEGLDEAAWGLPTDFFGWTAWDEIAHLCYFDEAALLAIKDESAFRRHATDLLELMVQGQPISAVARSHFHQVKPLELCRLWRERFLQLMSALRALGPKDRLPWYGPSMSALSFATARMMETWAHGQDIYDRLGRVRIASEVLKPIAHLGVSTFAWTFRNRQLDVPDQVPFVDLRGPQQARWQWGEPSSSQRIQGEALDFCLVVTQRRNWEDTELTVIGPAAQSWMAIAQCFAGPPAEPPRKGERRYHPRWLANA